MDKTGTLTEGKPRLTAVHAANGKGEVVLLLAAASIEQNSEHPLAAAIVHGAKERGVKLQPVTGFNSVTGGRVRGNVAGKDVVVGKLNRYNTLGVPVAAGALYPFFGGLLSPIIAGAAMSLSSVSVIGNAWRLRKARL